MATQEQQGGSAEANLAGSGPTMRPFMKCCSTPQTTLGLPQHTTGNHVHRDSHKPARFFQNSTTSTDCLNEHTPPGGPVASGEKRIHVPLGGRVPNGNRRSTSSVSILLSPSGDPVRGHLCAYSTRRNTHFPSAFPHAYGLCGCWRPVFAPCSDSFLKPQPPISHLSLGAAFPGRHET